MALISETERMKIPNITKQIEHVALAARPDFQDIFVDSMTFKGTPFLSHPNPAVGNVEVTELNRQYNSIQAMHRHLKVQVMNDIPKIYLLFGFLGAGKTTLVRNLLETANANFPTAVIVNEFGAVGIDGEIIQGKSIDMIELVSGCICCSLSGSLLTAIKELTDDKGAARVIIEATGVADPEDMLDDLEDSSVNGDFEVAPIVTVVDSSKFEKIRSILGEFYESQVLNADIVILNKIDLVSHQRLDCVTREVKALNPDAEIRFTQHCDIDSSIIFSDRTTQLLAVHSGHRHEHAHGQKNSHETMASFVLQPRNDLSRNDFEKICGNLPQRVWRMKGYMLLDGQPVLMQYSAGDLVISESATRDNYRVVVIGEELDTPQLEAKLGQTMTTAAA